MATKYAGQNALNKLMQLVKTALNSKADKTNATTSAAGLMSAEDKVKLDGVEVGANKTVVDSALSASSANPVQNKAVKTALDGLQDKMDDYYVTFTRQKDSSGEYSDEYTANHTAKEIYEAYQAGKRVWQKDIYERFPITSCTLLSTGEYIAYFTHFEPGNMMVCYGVNQKSDTAASTANKLVYGIIAPNPGSADNGKYLTVNGSNIAYTDLPDGIAVDDAMSSTSPNPVQNKVVKSYVDTKVSGLQTADQVQAAISSAITGVYTPKGSIAFASLPTAAAGNKGWVYNVSDAFTTTAAFVEGAGHSYGAGTNVVCVDAGSGSYKWDVLAGTVDLTELTADEVQTLWNSI